MSRSTLRQYKESRRVYTSSTPGVTIRRKGPKVGRNKQCKCESGLKFKDCCLPSIKAVIKAGINKN